MAEARLNYTASDINEGVKGGLDYNNLKSNIALKSNLPSMTKTSGNSAFELDSTYIETNGLELNEIIISGNNKLYYVCGNFQVHPSQGVIEAGKWTTIGKLADENQYPSRTVFLSAGTGYSTNVKVRISTASDTKGLIQIYPDKDMSNLYVYASGLYV